jgi:hypothetical protein
MTPGETIKLPNGSTAVVVLKCTTTFLVRITIPKTHHKEGDMIYV